MMKIEIENHLKNTLIPFWSAMEDQVNGGFYGYMDHDLALQKEADKGCILMSRITWFFSNAYMLLGDRDLLDKARHGYEFLSDYCFDPEYGGIYWSVTCEGLPADTVKHTYNQAFAIYALSSYYDASGDPGALRKTLALFHLIEEKMKDNKGYLEAFDRYFRPVSNEKLSENGVEAFRSMNTHLHVMEAYTELLRVLQKRTGGADMLREIWEALAWTCRLFSDRMWNPVAERAEVFFDRDWNSLINLWSSGHDIESSWLADRTVEILRKTAMNREEEMEAEEIAGKVHTMTGAMARHVYEKAFLRNSIVSEFERGNPAPGRVWWVQAEAVVGFLNFFGKYPEKTEYLTAAETIWNFIKKYFLDRRENSEWFWYITEEFLPSDKPIVEPWKCPYHNGRMCFEVIKRLS
jgi:mannobiose 2-epimerase